MQWPQSLHAATILPRLVIGAVTAYGGMLVLLFLMQRSLMYFPETERTSPRGAGLPEAAEVWLDTKDGERLVVWHVAPRSGNPVVLYFPGNGGSLRIRTERFRSLVADGIGLVALSYRGFGGSTGHPSEAGLRLDADAAYEFASARYSAERLVAWGESLGAAVAVALAAERPVGSLVLQSPFTSAAAVAAAANPLVPLILVRLLMHDQFRSDERITEVRAPVLVIHGARDEVIPIAFGEQLFGLVRSPKRFVRLPEGHHNDLDDHGALAAVRAFLAGRID